MSGLKLTNGKGLNRLKEMIEKGRSVQAAFARVYPLYQKLQIERFQSENASEGSVWPPLESAYAAYKTRRYGGGEKRGGGHWNTYPGSGSKMMIGTGMLAGAAIGPGSANPFPWGSQQHRAMFTATKMVIDVEQSGKNPDGSEFNYAEFADEARPFMSFGQPSIDLMIDEVRKFMLETKR